MKPPAILILLLAASLEAQTPVPASALKPAPAPKRAPTVANVPYGEHERQAETGRTHDGFWASADPDPGGERPRFGGRENTLVTQPWAQLTAPGDGLLF